MRSPPPHIVQTTRALTHAVPDASGDADSAASAVIRDFILRSTRQWAAGAPQGALAANAPMPDPEVLTALRELNSANFGPYFALSGAELKERCRELGLPTSGSKAELLLRLAEAAEAVPAVGEDGEASSDAGDSPAGSKGRKRRSSRGSASTSGTDADAEQSDAEGGESPAPRRGRKSPAKSPAGASPTASAAAEAAARDGGAGASPASPPSGKPKRRSPKKGQPDGPEDGGGVSGGASPAPAPAAASSPKSSGRAAAGGRRQGGVLAEAAGAVAAAVAATAAVAISGGALMEAAAAAVAQDKERGKGVNRGHDEEDGLPPSSPGGSIRVSTLTGVVVLGEDAGPAATAAASAPSTPPPPPVNGHANGHALNGHAVNGHAAPGANGSSTGSASGKGQGSAVKAAIEMEGLGSLSHNLRPEAATASVASAEKQALVSEASARSFAPTHAATLSSHLLQSQVPIASPLPHALLLISSPLHTLSRTRRLPSSDNSWRRSAAPSRRPSASWSLKRRVSPPRI